MVALLISLSGGSMLGSMKKPGMIKRLSRKLFFDNETNVNLKKLDALRFSLKTKLDEKNHEDAIALIKKIDLELYEEQDVRNALIRDEKLAFKTQAFMRAVVGMGGMDAFGLALLPWGASNGVFTSEPIPGPAACFGISGLFAIAALKSLWNYADVKLNPEDVITSLRRDLKNDFHLIVLRNHQAKGGDTWKQLQEESQEFQVRIKQYEEKK
jgi:hypothetical protein